MTHSKFLRVVNVELSDLKNIQVGRSSSCRARKSSPAASNLLQNQEQCRNKPGGSPGASGDTRRLHSPATAFFFILSPFDVVDCQLINLLFWCLSLIYISSLPVALENEMRPLTGEQVKENHCDRILSAAQSRFKCGLLELIICSSRIFFI